MFFISLILLLLLFFFYNLSSTLYTTPTINECYDKVDETQYLNNASMEYIFLFVFLEKSTFGYHLITS